MSKTILTTSRALGLAGPGAIQSADPAIPPATPTPAGTPISTDIVLQADLHIGAGQTYYFGYDGAWNSYSPGFKLSGSPVGSSDPAPVLYNAGTIVSISTTGAAGVRPGDGPAGSLLGMAFHNQAGGAVYALANGDQAFGVWENSLYGFDTVNDGLIQAVSIHDRSVGVYQSDYSRSVTNTATGVIRVWAHDQGIGVDLSKGGDVVNAGLIDVRGGAEDNGMAFFSGAIGVRGATNITNSGVIRVVSTDPLNPGIGIDIFQPYGGVTPAHVVNTGSVYADYAIYYDAASFGTSPWHVVIDNSGDLHGDVLLDGAKGNTLNNSGLIDGSIYFFDGDNIYNGAGGAVNGYLYLSAGHNVVQLGDDGEIVFGGFVGDDITGGAGNDFIEIGRGTNKIDGGGGFNTLSFGMAAGAITIDLGAGTAFAGVADTVANIQQVVGSLYGDTMTAGASAAVLIGGGGYDILTGGAGADTLAAGYDGGRLTGGGGADTFIYTGGDGAVTITDFKAGGDHDVLQIHSYASAQSIVQQGADTLITLSAGNTILLKNVTASSLAAGDITYTVSDYNTPYVSDSPAIFGVAPVNMKTDLHILAGETISETAYSYGFFGDSHALTNSGSITVDYNTYAINDYVTGIYLVDGFVNEAGAQLTVNSPTGSAEAFYSTANSVNYGQITVTAAGQAYGNLHTNGAGGVLTVTGGTYAIGAEAYMTNNGVISVHGGVVADWTRTDAGNLNSWETNNGIVNVTADGSGAPATGVAFAGVNTSAMRVINTGTINADRAFYAYDANYSYHQKPMFGLINSGVINGQSFLGDATDSIVNTGTINGAIHFGGGDAYYRGAGGYQTGGIYLGQGLNQVFLGAGPSTVYGGLYLDNYVGGDGDDVFVITHAASIINGGGGTNTVSFATALGAVTADLGAGTATAGGADTLMNIQRIVGSQYGDTLKAGAAGAELMGGAGDDGLAGGAGADRLAGGTGADVMTGGGGADTFVFSAGDGADVITDFKAGGDADVLRLYGYVSAQSVQQVGADTLVRLSATDTVLLKNVTAASLGAGDLIFSAAAAPAIAALSPEALGGSSTLITQRPLTFYAGETLSFTDAGVGILASSEHVAGDNALYNQSSFTSGGTIRVSQSTGGGVGFASEYGTPAVSVTLTNLATGRFIVSAADGAARGLYVEAFGQDLHNAGLFQVTASTKAYGVETWDQSFDLVNDAGGSILVTGGTDAYGALLHNSGNVTNGGTISATGTGTVAAIAVIENQSLRSVINHGAITAIGVGGAAQTYGLSFTGAMAALHMENYGAITAADALYIHTTYSGSYEEVYNYGQITGAIDLFKTKGVVENHGTITGDILLTDSGGLMSLDLRDGHYAGVVTVLITDAETLSKNTVYTGADNTTVRIRGNYDSPYIETRVIGGGGGVTTVQYDGLARSAHETLGAGGVVTVTGVAGTNILTHVDNLVFADGVLTYDQNNAAAVVMRMYDTAFQRAPDVQGAQYWTHLYESGGVSLATMAGDFANSVEFQNDIAGMSHQQIAAFMYQNTLDRAPDAQGLAGWTAYLDQGHSVADLVLAFSESAEHKALTAGVVAAGLWDGDFAYQQTVFMYEAAFGRLPDQAGLVNWAGALKNGLSLQAMAADFAGSSEFANATQGMNHTQMVDFMYQTALHRAPDAVGEAAWVHYLDQGGSAADLLLQFEQSLELQLANTAAIDHGVGWI